MATGPCLIWSLRSPPAACSSSALSHHDPMSASHILPCIPVSPVSQDNTAPLYPTTSRQLCQEENNEEMFSPMFLPFSPPFVVPS